MRSEQQTFGPYSPIRRAGDLYFISGQVGVESTTRQVPPEVGTQTTLALKNLAGVLASEGLALSDIVKTTIFLARMDDFTAVNEVYEEFFQPPRPARSTVAVRELPRVAGDTAIRIEIEAVACASHVAQRQGAS